MEHLNALLYILGIATAIFYFARKHIEPLLQPEEYVRWRNSWFAVTFIAFFAGNFWLYILATGIFVRHVLKKVDNRFAFYLVILFAIPVISQRIPKLFEIDYARLLALVILLPMLLSAKWRQNTPSLGKTLPDVLLILFITLVVLLDMRGTTVGDSLRGGVGFFLDWFLPYFIASRALHTFDQFRTAIIAFCMAGIIAGAIGFLENARAWLLYNALADALGVHFHLGAYLGRGNSLRALSSLGHPLVFGNVMMIVTGLFLFIGPYIKDNKVRIIAFLTVLAGLYAPVSRGPWVATAILFFLFMLMMPKALKRLAITFALAAIVIPILPTFPAGQKIINMMPFVGNVDKFNVDYREVLFDKGIEVVMRKPFFGVAEPAKEPEMADMVQGEGIVDIVNTYLNVVLENGIPGLILFVSFFLVALYRVNKSRRRIKDKKSHEYRCACSLLATMIALMISIFSVSGIGVLLVVTYVLAGLMFSFSRIIDNSTRKKKPWWDNQANAVTENKS